MGIGLHAFKSRLKSYKNAPWRNTKTSWGLNISKQLVKIIGTLKNQGFKIVFSAYFENTILQRVLVSPCKKEELIARNMIQTKQFCCLIPSYTNVASVILGQVVFPHRM
jgi:hypothetical protein